MCNSIDCLILQQTPANTQWLMRSFLSPNGSGRSSSGKEGMGVWTSVGKLPLVLIVGHFQL